MSSAAERATILPRSGPSPLRLLGLLVVVVVLLLPLLLLLDDQFSFFLSGGKGSMGSNHLIPKSSRKRKMEIETEIAGIGII